MFNRVLHTRIRLQVYSAKSFKMHVQAQRLVKVSATVLQLKIAARKLFKFDWNLLKNPTKLNYFPGFMHKKQD